MLQTISALSYAPQSATLPERNVAQPGSAPALGAGSRRFESSRSDHFPNVLQHDSRLAPLFPLHYTAQVNRVGIGYDVHKLKAGRQLILGGVSIPHESGLDGHSDADVLMHAICDAVLGAIGEGDIGSFFPPSEAQWKDAASNIFLEEAARQVEKRGGRINNVDAMLIAEAPKIGPHISAMKENIATALGIAPDAVGIKATTNETMGFVGRGEGMAAHAVASVELTD